MAILKYPNQSGVIYAYESISKWDPVKKQSRSKRKCLGRVDPETGEIIPTSKGGGRPSKNAESNYSCKRSADKSKMSATEKKLKQLTEAYEKIKEQNESLLEENKNLRALLFKIKKELADI